MSRLLVYKFGGTSLGSVSKIRRVAARVAEIITAGDRVLVVVSAMAGETNRLQALSASFSIASGREYDALLASGEQASAALLVMALEEIKVAACSLSARDIPILTEGLPSSSRIKRIVPDRLHALLEQSVIPVITGFQGLDETTESVTTLGRGGSDLTAVALAASVEADECVIVTDVEGLYSADPRLVSRAKIMENLGIDSALEMAATGARVLHDRALLYAKRYGVSLKVCSSYSSESGTLVSDSPNMPESASIDAVTHTDGKVLLTLTSLSSRMGYLSYFFAALKASLLDLEVLVSSTAISGESSVTCFISQYDHERSNSGLTSFLSTVDATLTTCVPKVGVVTLVGCGLSSASVFSIFDEVVALLSREGVVLYQCVSSPSVIRLVVPEKDVPRLISLIQLELIT